MLWLCAYLPLLGLEHGLQNPAESAGNERPRVLLAGNRVVQRDRTARQRGIAIGTSLAAAHSIATDLRHQQRDDAAEAARLRYLGEVLYRYSSQVSLHSAPGGYLDHPATLHHSVLLEISASLKLFGDQCRLLTAAQQELKTLGHRGVLHVAPTPAAAVAGARWRALEPRVAPVNCSGSGWQATYQAMPLRCLALSERQGEALHSMGQRTCGALLALPRKALGQRFGATLSDYLARFVGTRADPQPLIDPPTRFSSGVHLLEPCTSKTALAFTLQRLCREFGHWLVAQQLGVCRLRWTFGNHSGDRQQVEVQLSSASQAAALLLKLSQLQLERIDLPADVLDIRLDSRELQPWINHSEDLFGGACRGVCKGAGSGTEAGAVSELIDRLRARLGPTVCGSIAPRSDHRPEHAWVARPADPGAHSVEPARAAAFRPLWLLPQPRPVAADRLELLHGPERIQGGWWQRALRRDYYIARETGGQGCCWAFVDGRQRWFVHGYFG